MLNGNIIDTVGIDVNQLDVFDVSKFQVNITNGNVAQLSSPVDWVEDMYTSADLPYKFYTDVSCTLLNDYVWYYDIECKFILSSTDKSDDWFSVFYDSKSLSDYSNYFDFECGKNLRIYRGLENYVGDIWFRIVNKETGQVVHIKKISISGSDNTTEITDVIIFDNEEDISNNNGVSDSTGVIDNTNSNYSSNYSSWGLGYSEVSWSDIRNMISTSGDFWQCVRLILSCVPTWITAPIFFFISAVVTIVLTKMLVSAVTAIMG